MTSGPAVRAIGAWLALSAAALASARIAPAQPFTDVTAAAGILHEHGYTEALASPDGTFSEAYHFAGGVAAGDYDDDGDIDLFFVRGNVGPSVLYRNRGDGTFTEVGAQAGLDLDLVAGCGPTFADIDGDGWLDLLVGGVEGSALRVLRNDGAGRFVDVTSATGIDTDRNTFSAAFGDYDRDGDVDLALAHWATFLEPGESTMDLWRNDGGFLFTDVSIAAGTSATVHEAMGLRIDFSFTPTFSDIDDDGWPDLLFAGDFGRSRILLNQRDGTFRDVTDPSVITDENAMGSAVGDYDNDGRLDWFVSSIWDPAGATTQNWGVTGNRLYRGNGDGTFVDVTEAAGVREGFWGWAASWADLDDDGHLDLVHVNGMGREPGFPPSRAFERDPTRVYLSRGDGTFSERAVELGLDDDGMGRGLVVADFDRDGDLDVLIANNGGAPRLFRNERTGAMRHLGIRLRGRSANREAAGAKILLRANGVEQLREIRIGSNYVSQNPAEAHFGLGSAALVESVEVIWPGGARTRLTDVAPAALIELHEPDPGATPTPAPPECAGDCSGDFVVTVDEIVRAVAIALGAQDVGRCRAADPSGDGDVTVEEIVSAIAAALGGCD